MSGAFDNKRVLVTGGARGIGAATACAFHARGATVAIGARSQASIAAFLGENDGARYLAAPGDLSDRDACHAVVDAAVSALGGLDILVNCAGIFEEVAFEDVSQAHWDETIAFNLGGTFFTCQAAMPDLREARGNVVNIASDAGLIAYSPAPAYCAAKGGVVNLTRTLAFAYARHVRVNCVCPGNVATEMIEAAARSAPDAQAYMAQANARAPMGRMATPDEIAHAVLYLASDEAGFTTGVALPVDGGGTAGFD